MTENVLEVCDQFILLLHDPKKVPAFMSVYQYRDKKGKLGIWEGSGTEPSKEFFKKFGPKIRTSQNYLPLVMSAWP